MNPHRLINKTLIDGSVVIRDLISRPAKRLGFERAIPSMKGFERAHSRGAGLGNEYVEGIFYATKEVNQALQNHGIERFLRELFAEKRKEVNLYLTTVTKPHANSLRLMEITYKLDAVYNNREFGVFEVTLEVDNNEQNPKAHITHFFPFTHYSKILIPKKPKPSA